VQVVVGSNPAVPTILCSSPEPRKVTILDILVTNDDGVHAPGIRSLAAKLRDVGDVTVVAPAREMSAVSHALTIAEPVRFDHIEPRVFAVEGTPADCVNLAVSKLLPKPPDVVVSGINRGANVGDDIAYSGTVAGAREAAMLGVPSLAVSLATKEQEADYSNAAHFAAVITKLLFEKKNWGRRTFLNVNVPNAPVKGVRITSQGHRDYWAKVEERIDPRSRVYYWIKQGFNRWEKNGMSDIAALRERFISVTPLQFDFTAYSALEELDSWELKFNGQ
jgi:5'-nucleotidase